MEEIKKILKQPTETTEQSGTEKKAKKAATATKPTGTKKSAKKVTAETPSVKAKSAKPTGTAEVGNPSAAQVRTETPAAEKRSSEPMCSAEQTTVELVEDIFTAQTSSEENSAEKNDAEPVEECLGKQFLTESIAGMTAEQIAAAETVGGEDARTTALDCIKNGASSDQGFFETDGEKSNFLEDEPAIIIKGMGDKKRARSKPWSELTKNEKASRLLAVVMSLGLVFLLTFVTVWGCIIADRAYREPQWKTEREVSTLELKEYLKNSNADLYIPPMPPNTAAPRFFLTAKTPFDMRYTLFPTGDNIKGYRIAFASTLYETTDPTVFVSNFYGYAEPVDALTEKDGTEVGLHFWSFTAREKITSRSVGNEVYFVTYTLSAVVKNRLYQFSTEAQSKTGELTSGQYDYARQLAAQVITNLSDTVKTNEKTAERLAFVV